MTEYDSGPRPLTWPLLHPLVGTTTVEGVTEVTPSFVWPADPDQEAYIAFKLTLNEYNVLSSALDVGSDIAFAEDGLRVMWLWQRNFIDGTVNKSEDIGNMCCGDSLTDSLNFIGYQAPTSATYATNQAQWETDGQELTTIAPNMVPGGGVPQSSIDRVLCLGYEMMLKSIIEQARGVNAASNADKTSIVRQLGISMTSLSAAGGIALLLGGAAAGVVTFLGGPWMLLGLAMAGVGTGISSLFLQADNSVLDDAVARARVLCTMRENGMGKKPTRGMFSQLLNPNDFAPGSNEEKLYNIVRVYLLDLTFYLQFMMSMSDLYDSGIFGVLPFCEVCPEPGCFDLRQDPENWFAGDAGGNPNSGFGSWQLGQGFLPAPVSNGFFIVRSPTVALSVNWIEFQFLEDTDGITWGILGTTSYAMTGGARKKIRFDSTTHPGAFPASLAFNNYVTRYPGNALVSSSNRLIKVCWEPAI